MNKSEWSKRICPSCGSDETNVNADISSTLPAENLTFNEVKSSFIGLRDKQLFFSFFRCSKCSLIYSPYYFSPDQLNELYSEMPDNLMGEDRSVALKTQSTYIKQISKYVGDVDSFLELGPDIGLVTKEAISVFNPHSITLVEPNKAMWPELRLLNASNLDIYESVQDIPKSLFNLVVGIHVFDHLVDLKDEFIAINRNTASTAVLAMVVHNEKSILRFLLGKKWPPFCLQHPQLFNPKSARQMLENHGWVVVKVTRTTNYYTSRNFIQLALKIIGKEIEFLNKIPSFQIPVKLGNILIIAKKK
jgi:hypothetical protein